MARKVIYIVFARDDLSGYMEGRALEAADSLHVARFLQEEVVTRHRCPRRIVLDGGAENLGFTEEIMRKYGIYGASIAPYHPQSNGLVERGHQTIINAIAKYHASDSARYSPMFRKDWTWYVSLAMWADRVSVRRSTGYSAFELVYGRECLLPIQLAINSWNVINWNNIKDREKLILARMQQLDERRLSEIDAAWNLHRSRIQNKSYYDVRKRLRTSGEKLWDLVVLFRLPNQKVPSRARKLDERWAGPYRIRDEMEDSSYYMLEELDGVPLKRKYPEDQLKKYFARRGHLMGWAAGEEDFEEVEEKEPSYAAMPCGLFVLSLRHCFSFYCLTAIVALFSPRLLRFCYESGVFALITWITQS
jgi:hypothetical protein